MESHDLSFWKEAINVEMDSIIGGVIHGIKIVRSNDEISLIQSHCTVKVLKKFNCDNYTPVNTPMDPNVKLIPNSGNQISQLEYSRVIGCLMYTMTSTRSDIAFAIKKLRRYLKSTMNYDLIYARHPSVMEGCSNAS
ncbi:hypothetical protein RND81_01G109800 [Saponaria officinalis]|uniref:Reverse transcriptase Ty1/copia-type domain-containing protein n=1 Tax=Saponaria officinalis TaxID=3572 RepID=A0AAW1NHY6_SAPOF